MNFADVIKNETKWTLTENGAVALNTTSNKVLDLFSTIGSLRETSDERITTLVSEAYSENPDLAMKTLFWARDIRGGAGERNVFRVAIKWLATYHPDSVRKNIKYFGEYGRFDDLYCLVGTPVENDMWTYVRSQLITDMKMYQAGESVSLLAKWLKTADASSANTRKMGIYTAKKLGLSVYVYKRMVRKLRKRIKIVESQMCAQDWDKIQYDEVPSRASMIYRDAFKRHDEERYSNFINKAISGEVKINASTLYPYDLIEKYESDGWRSYWKEEDASLEALWKNLPNYVEPGTNAVVIADTSGSMMGRPMNSAIGLAIYFAERNTGPYHNLWMNFSTHPSWQQLRGETLQQKLHSINMDNWDGSTNMEAAFRLVLDTAIKNGVKPEEMPKSIIVISDMEINTWGGWGSGGQSYLLGSWTFYDKMRADFAAHGYEIPQVIFWNVNSRHDVFHADSTHKGVVLCSGQSTSTFKTLMNSINETPVEYMMRVLGAERYAVIAA